MFRDRTHAGRLLAERIRELRLRKPLVLAIPRGGVPVAKELALAIGARLDLIITRKIGAPGNPEFAIGAVNQEGEAVLDRRVIRIMGIEDRYVKEAVARGVRQVRERMEKYRRRQPYPELLDKTAVIVDDGIATGNTMAATIESVRRKKPGSVIVAVPVAPRETVERLSRLGDKVVCLDAPEFFYAIGEFYERFDEVGDRDVRAILDEVNSRLNLRRLPSCRGVAPLT